MSQQLLNTKNLIAFHEELTEFAKHHHNKGGQEAHRLVKALWDEERESLHDGSKEGILRAEGYEQAFKEILTHLHKKFVP